MNLELIQALHDLEKEKGINFDVLVEAIEAALISAYKKNFGTLQNVRVAFNKETGEINVFSRKTIVEKVNDPRLEISLDEARRLDPRYELNDIVEFEETPQNFGRIAAQTAKQVVVQRIREAERDLIYDEFTNREGDIVTGIIQRVENRAILIDFGKTEAVLSLNEQILGEQYVQGARIKTYIIEVKKTTKGPQILVSRTHPGLLKRLFELEVPEIHDGIVEIKSVSREAGSRSKIAVHSKNENVDPVGSCVGPKGMRVQNIVQELKGEKIDIVKWSSDPTEFIANALSPAKVLSVDILPTEKVARVVVPDYQLSLAIGKEGQNARLAAKLTGWKIDIKSESQLRADIEQKLFNINSESAGDEYSERDGGEEVLEENLKGGAGEEVPEEGLEGDIGEEIPKEDVEAGDEISEEGTSERDLDENIV
ncbi:MAG TPA: transcription termination/antitermination protein NusA [Ruminiclostridium sp.]|nr:transcription termination/antitermination protein NusA [Ruminiclostridium sp.]